MPNNQPDRRLKMNPFEAQLRFVTVKTVVIVAFVRLYMFVIKFTFAAMNSTNKPENSQPSKNKHPKYVSLIPPKK